MSKITVELEVTEALTALGPIQDRALSLSQMAALATGEEQEILLMSAGLLRRAAARLTDALYPRCRWMDDEPCDRFAEDDGLCNVHAAHRAAVQLILQ